MAAAMTTPDYISRVGLSEPLRSMYTMLGARREGSGRADGRGRPLCSSPPPPPITHATLFTRAHSEPFASYFLFSSSSSSSSASSSSSLSPPRRWMSAQPLVDLSITVADRPWINLRLRKFVTGNGGHPTRALPSFPYQPTSSTH